MTWPRTWAVVATLALAGAMGTGVLIYVLGRADHNRAAIRVSCIVLSKVVVQSGAGGTQRPRRTELSRALARLNTLRQRAIVRAMTPAEAVEAKALMAFIDRAGGAVEIPDCDDIAANPGKIEREYDAEEGP